MYSEGKAVVHLVDISPTSEPQKADSGVVHHVAFVSRGFAAMKDRLKSKGMAFEARQVPGGDLWQIFVNDPNGVLIELNYEAAKEQGSGSAPAERADDVGRK
jgi:catechol 2,3-dioxygenase-like lactoylglutathione lyase family enzyme